MLISEPRRLDPLSGEEAIDLVRLDPQDPPDADCLDPAVVNQSPDRLRMDAEERRNLADAVEGGAVLLN